MCGICGYYGRHEPVDEKLLRKMCATIIHRGPDDEGIYLDAYFGMGMRRLSIIDLNTGHQPICNEDGLIWTVFNGEIYNYIELRNELMQQGHRFKTQTDTEVIVHLYEEQDVESFKRLRGMFGIAIWDNRKKELLLARDHLGIKQLYVCDTGESIVFGSEIKCLLAHPRVRRKVNPEAIQQYLTFLYFPQQLTAFSGIEKVLPGHYLRITKNGIAEHREFWNLNHVQEQPICLDEAREKFLSLFNDSVRMHLRSDVPLGVFLSGGLDSATIATTARHALEQQQLHTFTVGYGNEGAYFDERCIAATMAKQLVSSHHEYEVSPDLKQSIELLIGFFDEPFANSSAIPNYYLSQKISQSIKVALSGLGGDEIGGGYERYLGMKWLSTMQHVPLPVRHFLWQLSSRLPDSKQGALGIDRLKRFWQASTESLIQSYYSIITTLDDARRQSLFSSTIKSQLSADTPFYIFNSIINQSQQNDMLRSMIYFDIVSYMTNDLLVLTDRTSMANSLEVRVPYLDIPLVEFMFSLPFTLKIHGKEKKFLIKEAFRKVLPDKILHGKKRGFSTPVAVWLRNKLLAFAHAVLSPERIAATGLLDAVAVQRLFDAHLARKANYQGILFGLLTFVLWHERYIQDKKYGI